ncbi:hypothetical protein [Streptomyces sp. NPDC058625]|uniref:hypothetical protein n=1 Tax=Streptomyces sp. NPDC058625 TaxID=3346564 RepID=UPI00364ED53C
MPITKPEEATPETSMGPMVGFIDPRKGLTERHDEHDTLFIIFTLVVFKESDEFFATKEARYFKVWAEGQDAKKLKDAFAQGLTGLSRNDLRVVVDVSDLKVDNHYDKVAKEWVNDIEVYAKTVTRKPL